MSKKSREKKRRKQQRRGLPGYAGSFADRQGESPAQRALRERIARGGDHYVQDNFIRIMQSSHILRNEPEFRNLHFDLPETDASAGTANASTPPSSKAEARAHSRANLGERVARFLGRGKES